MTVKALGILASAGTGKTYRLTGELLELLLSGRPPESVFAATFTRTAAAEILERVLRRLCDAATTRKGLADLREALKNPTLTADECRRCAATLGRSIDRLAVWTLDSFLFRIATAFSVEIGLAPGWRIADDDEDAALRRAAVGRVLREARGEIILPLLRMLKKSEGERSVHESISSVVNAVHEAYVQAVDGAWGAVGPEDEPLGEDELSETIHLLEHVQPPSTQRGTPNKNWASALAGLREVCRNGDWEAFLSSTLVCAAMEGRTFARQEIPPQFAEPCLALGRHARAVVLQKLRDQNTAAAELVRRFDAVYTDLKRQSGTVGFGDLPRLLASRNADRIRDELYYRLDARVEHLLLDEFQDTSVAQFRVVEPVIGEIVSDETRPRSFFYVGDAKQSLFGWRHAEPTLLAHLSKRWPQIEAESLARSFRSSPRVIDAVNAVFGSLDRCPVLQDAPGRAAAREWSELFTEHTCDASVAKLPGRVVVVEYPAVQRGSPRQVAAEVRCEFVADRVAEIARRAPSATIGVLMRTKAWIPRLVAALSQRGIEATEEGGSPIVQSPAVAAIVSLLRLADHPGDHLAAFHVATTALGAAVGLDRSVEPAAVREVSRHVREDLTRRGASAVVGDWARWLGPVCSEIDRARLAQAAEVAECYQERESSGVRGLIEMLELSRRPVGLPASVRLMTIHAAKGLEFDAVIAPELDGRVPSRPPEVLFQRDDLLGPITRISLSAPKVVCSAGSVIGELAAARQQREIREALCLLYVTMTRARRYLEMIVHPPGEGESFRLSRVVCSGLVDAGEPADDRDDPVEENLDASRPLIRYEHGDVQWHHGIKAEQPRAAERPAERVLGLAGSRALVRSASDLEEADEVLREASPAASPVRAAWRPVTAASLVVGEADKAVDGRSRVRAEARALGIAVHACLERIGWIDSGPPTDEALLASVRAVELPFDVSEHEVILAVRRVLDRPSISALLTSARYAPGAERTVQLLREIVCAGVIDQNDSTVRGRMDRLVIVREKGRPVAAEVIDWKTDGMSAAKAGSASQPHAPNLYRPQLEGYARIVSRVLGIARADITATVAFVSSGTVVSYDPA